MKVVAVVGISGVGKTTMLNQLSELIEFHHLGASQIIKNEQRATTDETSSSEALRLGDIERNQQHLVAGFHRQKSMSSLVVLDAHVFIDTGDTIHPIEPDVFLRIGIEAMIFLETEPAKIASHRRNDKARKRPELAIGTLSSHQQQAKETARSICDELKIPLYISAAGDLDHLATIFKRLS